VYRNFPRCFYGVEIKIVAIRCKGLPSHKHALGGLAIDCLEQDLNAFNLVRSYKQRRLWALG
jgi:hypothetical protein